MDRAAVDPAAVAGDVSTRLTRPGARGPRRATPGARTISPRVAPQAGRKWRGGAASDGDAAGNAADAAACCAANKEGALTGATQTRRETPRTPPTLMLLPGAAHITPETMKTMSGSAAGGERVERVLLASIKAVGENVVRLWETLIGGASCAAC